MSKFLNCHNLKIIGVQRLLCDYVVDYRGKTFINMQNNLH